MWRSALLGAQITGNESPDADQEEVEAASDAQRVRRIREAIQLDRVRLEQARADQPQRQELFDLLAKGIAAWKADQQKKMLLNSKKTGDPEQRASLEREISKLDDDLELLRAQSEQVFSAPRSLRQQIEVLEKKIERERRTVDVRRRGQRRRRQGGSVLIRASPGATRRDTR